jgi:hypothetical protein
MWTTVQAHHEGRAYNTFLADDCHLYASSVARKHHQRSHAVIQKICIVDLRTRFMEDVLGRQIQWLQIVPKQAVLVFWNRPQD